MPSVSPRPPGSVTFAPTESHRYGFSESSMARTAARDTSHQPLSRSSAPGPTPTRLATSLAQNYEGGTHRRGWMRRRMAAANSTFLTELVGRAVDLGREERPPLAIRRLHGIPQRADKTAEEVALPC